MMTISIAGGGCEGGSKSSSSVSPRGDAGPNGSESASACGDEGGVSGASSFRESGMGVGGFDGSSNPGGTSSGGLSFRVRGSTGSSGTSRRGLEGAG